MQRLPAPDEFAFGHDISWFEVATAQMVSGDVSDQPVEEQYIGIGVEASSWCVLPERVAGQTQDHAGDGGT